MDILYTFFRKFLLKKETKIQISSHTVFYIYLLFENKAAHRVKCYIPSHYNSKKSMTPSTLTLTFTCLYFHPFGEKVSTNVIFSEEINQCILIHLLQN